MEFKKINNQEDLKSAIEIRKIVFVKELESLLEHEIDEYDVIDDDKVIHFLVNKNNIPIAAAKCVLKEDHVKIERLCVLKDYRKYKIGKDFLLYIEDYLQKNYKENIIILDAVVEAINFYKKLDYKIISEVFVDYTGAEVQTMKKIL